MSARKILTIGFEPPLPDCQNADFASKQSLLDWDVILFNPSISAFVSRYAEDYQGKACLDDSSSFQLKECCEHWRREIKEAVDAGKTVIVFLIDLHEIYIDTGKRTYSGTGRNRQATRVVALYSNYYAIPESLSPVAATGHAMKLASPPADCIAAFWNWFKDVSQYRVILTEPKIPACIVTRTGDKPVGALYQSKTVSGTLLLLPDIGFNEDYCADGKDDEIIWTVMGRQFAARLIAEFIALDKLLRSSSEITAEPGWASDSRYSLRSERVLRAQLIEAETQVELAQKRKEILVEELRVAGTLRALLFEKGKLLENAIIKALRLLGFSAASFQDSSSEFDVVFESDEGRLIGEAEGKDSKAINIDKLRQLSMNIHEDLQREEVKSPAKPVLFGNAFRLVDLEERGNPFTEKCISAAATCSTALVFTPDLFQAAQYLADQGDVDYARSCRIAILTTTGRVVFPMPPSSNQLGEVHEKSTDKVKSADALEAVAADDAAD